MKFFRKKFAKQLAKLNPAYNKKIPFKLDDNEDFGASEGELKAFVPHGLGRHVKPDGSCWVLLRECYIELIRSSGTVYEGYWRKGQYHGTGETSFCLIFAGSRRCYLFLNNLKCFRLPLQSSYWTFTSRRIQTWVLPWPRHILSFGWIV